MGSRDIREGQKEGKDKSEFKEKTYHKEEREKKK